MEVTEEKIPINNLNEIKLNEKEWKFFARTNDKLLRWAEKVYHYTDSDKDACVEFLKNLIKHEFKVCDIKETYISEMEQYLIEFSFGNKSVYCICSINPSSGFLPTIVPGDEVNI